MLISIWIPKGTALIRGRRLLEVRCLLDDIWYLLSNCLFSYCSQQQMNKLEGISTDWISLQKSEAAISRCFLAVLKEFAKFAGIPTKWRSFSSTAGGLDLYLHLWVTPSVTNVTEAFHSKYLQLTWLGESTRMEAPFQYLNLSAKVFLHGFKAGLSRFSEKCIYIPRMVFLKSFKMFKITFC